jgi:glycosyltransferase involved in cell wall biosynthesis
MPKVSVIVPTHNRALSLCRAVDSVLNQSFRDLEVLIIDDASTDHTADFVADCGDDRVRYYRHDENRGESASSNTGLLLARGEYIAFLHDDDVWLREKLAKQVSLLDASGPQVGAVYTGYIPQRLKFRQADRHSVAQRAWRCAARAVRRQLHRRSLGGSCAP